MPDMNPTSQGRRRKLRMRWTCCDACHAQHLNKLTAWLHWLWLRFTRKA